MCCRSIELGRFFESLVLSVCVTLAKAGLKNGNLNVLLLASISTLLPKSSFQGGQNRMSTQRTLTISRESITAWLISCSTDLDLTKHVGKAVAN